MVGTLRKRKRLLIAINAVLAAAIAVCIAVFVAMPMEAGPSQRRAATRPPDIVGPPERPIEPLSAYAVIYKRDLRKGLFDVTRAVVVKARPKLTVHLEGTVLEPGFTYAILRSKSGRTKFVSVGQTFEGAEVTAVTAHSATVKLHGELVTLRMPDKEGRQ